MTRHVPGYRAIAVAGLLALALAGPASADGVYCALVPATVIVSSDSTFTLEFQSTQPGASFNAFDATVSFDTTACVFLQASPKSLQVGSLMSGACGNTFHIFAYNPGADSMTISLSLLCPNQSLTGPGQLYKLRFRARSGAHDSWVRMRRTTFYNAGFFVDSVFTQDAHVISGIPAAVPPPGPAGSALRVRVGPNPSRGWVALSLEGRVSGAQRLEIHDLLGRSVRRIDVAGSGASVRWDGRDDAGRALPAGLYLVTWRAGDAVARGRVTLTN